MKKISDEEIYDCFNVIINSQRLHAYKKVAQAQLDFCEEEMELMFNPDYLKFKDGVKAGRQLQRIADREEVKEIFEELTNLIYENREPNPPVAEMWLTDWQALKQKYLGH